MPRCKTMAVWVLLWVCGLANATQPELDVISRSLQQRTAQAYAFTQERRVKILNRPVTSSGVLSFSPQKGMCWAIQKPYASRLLIGDQGIFEVKDSGYKQLLMPSANPVFETFSRVYLALFRGEINALKRDFVLTPVLTNEDWDLQLQPSAHNSLSWLSTIDFRKQGDRVVLALTEKNGDTTQIEFAPLESAVDEATRCW